MSASTISHARPELTLRAIITGMLIGAVLTPCNVYTGLKIGWTFNMSVAAGLIGFGFWTLVARGGAALPYGIHENNINQTSASAAASIISAGLAAPIPALALITGETLSYPVLVAWLFIVSVLGIVVAAGLRNQLLLRERLTFPPGVVTAETMREIHGGGVQASARLGLLAAAAALGAILKFAVARLGLAPAAPPLGASISTPREGVVNVTATNLGVSLDPSVLMFGFGAISGLRIGVSVLLGAAIAWLGLAPLALSNGWASPGPAGDQAWFGPLVEWLVWPGATLMVAASLASLVISLVKLALRHWRGAAGRVGPAEPVRALWRDPRVLAVLALVMAACVVAQVQFFGIGLREAMLAVALSYVLAIVAARVSGETAITPIGALGQITQLIFGWVAPGQVTANLMTANVTGGAAGQCADLMHDLRTGQIIGASANFQIVAQFFGVLVGAFVAAATYLALIPDPQAMLITAEWPAPAVATWKAVAEVMSEGLGAMPPAAGEAILIAAVAGVGLALAENLSGPEFARFIPSGSAIGLAFVIPAFNSISLFLGALVAALLSRLFPGWASRTIVAVAAGLIVGESLAGVVDALAGIVR
jgi:putative OPT family oligopeptide transporter